MFDIERADIYERAGYIMIVDFEAVLRQRNAEKNEITEIFYEDGQWNAVYQGSTWSADTIEELYSKLGWDEVVFEEATEEVQYVIEAI